jgi:hypothetical protein
MEYLHFGSFSLKYAYGAVAVVGLFHCPNQDTALDFLHQQQLDVTHCPKYARGLMSRFIWPKSFPLWWKNDTKLIFPKLI